jgi:FlaG protein
MHTEDTASTGTNERLAEPPALTAVVPLERPEPKDAASDRPRSIELAVSGASAGERSLSVHYELDPVTHRWVASILDDSSGEVVRTVPSTQVLHQLAALRRPGFDVRA